MHSAPHRRPFRPTRCRPPTGNLEVYYGAGDGTSATGVLPIENGEARLDAPVPGHVQCRTQGVVGYWFKEKRVKVADGEDPFRITLTAVPAGAIYGSVTGHGETAEHASIRVAVVEKSPLVESPFLRVAVRLGEPGGDFSAGPLPLGGTYAIVARRGRSYVVSLPLKLDAQNPAREVALKFPEGRPIRVQILDPDGDPVRGAPVQLRYNIPYSGGFGSGNVYTDRDGRVTFEHVNPDVPGGYTLELPFERDYQSERLAVKPDGKPVTIRLKKGLVLTGVVVDDATGYPVPDAEVYAHPEDREPGQPWLFKPEGKTDARGRFRFSNMATGRYSIGLDEMAHAGPDGSLTVTAGQEAPVEVRVRILEWSKLQPRKP